MSSISSKAGECSEASTRLALWIDDFDDEEDEVEEKDPDEDADDGEEMSIGDMVSME